ncbi:MAG: DUF1295 domain-containing protein [Fidelibacterota bacterium]|nr:MAG: DUF1295 domain-containing protein [Candidatus Neomarinimicrobiota bacterium]
MTPLPWEIFVSAAPVVLVFITAVWILSLLIQDASIMDIFWGPGFVIAATWYLLSSEGYEPRRVLIISLVMIWGFRLAGYLLLRSRGKPEDPRYQTWRLQAGQSWWWQSYLKVFLLQGLILWVLSLPLLAALAVKEPAYFTWTDGLGALFWVIGFVVEAAGDWQLYRFKREPENKGRVLDTGLWAYTRHPNYFGEALLWWGYGFISLSSGAYWLLFSPLLMTVLLLRVSGVTMLERRLRSEKPEYETYIRTTNAFFPRVRKRGRRGRS